MPYTFPSGATLRQDIITELSTPGRDFAVDVMNAHGCDWALAEAFRTALQHSSLNSIDLFLERRQDFIDFGKICIARALIPLEQEEQLYVPHAEKWYSDLYTRLSTPTADDFSNNQLSIITYNYDRSLEQCLFLALQNTYHLTNEESASLLRHIPIVHLHGNLGNLEVLHGNGRPYSPIPNVDALRQCANTIKIIHEDVVGSPEFPMAQHLIDQAEVICFLGFGYNEVNLERIFAAETAYRQTLKKQLYGTSYGFPEGEKQVVRQRFNNRIQLDDMTVVNALRKWGVLT